MNGDRLNYRFWEHEDWHDVDSRLVPVYSNIVDGCDPTIAVGDFELCTGLKDNEGDPIYEGDYIADSKGTAYKVVWDNELAQFTAIGDGDPEVDFVEIFDLTASTAKNVWVSGNIHTGKQYSALWCEANHSSMIG